MTQPSDYTQLQMLYPAGRVPPLPQSFLAPGYALRNYCPGDEPRFYEVMALAGFDGWNDERLNEWLPRLLPDGWFLGIHAASGQVVASTMAFHGHTAQHPFGGELGWVAADPAHAGKGLGMAVCAAVTGRLVRGGYHNIYLLTDDWRLPAIKVYLKLGYLPWLFKAEMPARWQVICEKLNWPYTPQDWPATI
jgi:mycothiol synthase